MTGRISIYGLEDPRTSIIRYVGQSDDVYRRFIEHMTSNNPENPKDCWIQYELRPLNLMVVMRNFEVIDFDQKLANEREAYWIHHYSYLCVRAGYTFYNRYLPVNKVTMKYPKLPDNAALLARLEAIPEWETKLEKLTSVIGCDMSEVWKTLFNKVPGGRNHSDLKAQYDVLVEAYRYQQSVRRQA